MAGEILGFHGGESSFYDILGCDTVQVFQVDTNVSGKHAASIFRDCRITVLENRFFMRTGRWRGLDIEEFNSS
jgi:hypothetical protein